MKEHVRFEESERKKRKRTKQVKDICNECQVVDEALCV